MRILTIDTAGFTEIVGVADGGTVLASVETPAGRGQERTLLAAVDEMLAAAGVTVDDLDGIAVSIGPGRFSGLRVGLATAKGLAAPVGCPVWGIPTLEALATAAASADDADDAGGAAGTPRWILAATDARRGEVYAALFERDGSTVRRVTEDRAMPPADAARWAVEQAGGERVLFAGSGAEAYRDDFGAAGPSAAFAEPASVERAVLALASLAERAGTDGATDAGGLEPVYIRGAVG